MIICMQKTSIIRGIILDMRLSDVHFQNRGLYLAAAVMVTL